MEVPDEYIEFLPQANGLPLDDLGSLLEVVEWDGQWGVVILLLFAMECILLVGHLQVLELGIFAIDPHPHVPYLFAQAVQLVLDFGGTDLVHIHLVDHLLPQV